jgi:hypothetical protein
MIMGARRRPFPATVYRRQLADMIVFRQLVKL